MKASTLLLSLALLASASATSFNAAYSFDDGMNVTATFTGSLDGNLITDIGNVSAYVTGSWWPDGGYSMTNVQSYDNGGYTLAEGGAFMSLDGSFMNFRFTTENRYDDDFWDYNSLWSAYSPLESTSLYHYEAGGNYVWDAARWSINVEQEQQTFARFAQFSVYEAKAVPEGGVTGLLALCMVGFVAVRRMLT